MMIFMFSFVCAWYIFSDLVPLYQEKQWKVFWLDGALIALAFFIYFLDAIHGPTPNISLLIRRAVTAVFGL